MILVRKGTTGRYFGALRGSETAAASIGINATLLRIMLFALAAGVAGVGGGLLAMDDGTINPINSYPAHLRRAVGRARRHPRVAHGRRCGQRRARPRSSRSGFSRRSASRRSSRIIGFGLGAITYARHPEGIVEFQTRKNILAQRRQRALKERATELAEEGKLPAQYRPVWHIVVPVLAGPALYFLYILVRSPLQGHWVAVHSTTLLVFIVPSVLVALVWIVLTDTRLRKIGGYPSGPLVLAAGAVGGLLAGWWFEANEWVPRASLVDCLLVGLPAGIAAVAFFLLPMHVQRIGRARGWLSAPISWHDGSCAARLPPVRRVPLLPHVGHRHEHGRDLLRQGVPARRLARVLRRGHHGHRVGAVDRRRAGSVQRGGDRR